MSIIKGIEKLNEIISEQDINKLEKAAKHQLEQKNISYAVIFANNSGISIGVEQLENRSGRYASAATLEKNAQQVFKKHLSEFELSIHASAFLPRLVDTVTTSWLEGKMQEKGIRIKQIAFDTGIDRETIADWITGKRQMSQLVKAMLFFYLK